VQSHWSGRSAFVHHLWWHRALYLQELEQWQEVIALYDSQIRTGSGDFYLDIQNASSILWRLALRGIEVGTRWTELADVAELHNEDFSLPLTNVHFMLALLGANRTHAAAAHIQAMRKYCEASRGGVREPTARVLDLVAIPVCEGLAAFHDGVYNRAAERLMKCYARLIQLGGSHAQRDVLVLTLVESSLRGGYPALGRDLMEERTGAKSSSPNAWHRYARALQLCRDVAGAKAAEVRGDYLLRQYAK
jgi:hypothetical protein